MLSNVVLDELDQELERRGHRFCRYADDCNIFVRTSRAAERVLRSITRYVEGRLLLRVNRRKSAIGRSEERTFLGHVITTKGLKLADKSLKRFKACVRLIISRKRGVCLKQVIAEVNRYVRGWVVYFRYAQCWWLLREDEIETNIEEARDLMRDSIEGLKDLAEMAYNLKDFSRLDRSPVANFDVNAGLERSLMIARNVLKYKANVRTSFGELPKIECRPSQINQIFLNILTNAAQAIEEEGEIVIVTKLHGPDQVSISITDNGCGIPEDNLSQLRDPFFTTKEVGMGTGLGLSIVDEIVRAHGGELVIESEVHKGSSFTILLPIKQPSEMATEKRDVLISKRTEQTQTQALAEAS